MKLFHSLAVLACAALVGCGATAPVKPEVLLITDRDVAYVPYPSCPAPNKITPSALPIALINDQTPDKEVVDSYIKTIAVLKADLQAALDELDLHQKAYEKAKAEEYRLKAETPIPTSASKQKLKLNATGVETGSTDK